MTTLDKLCKELDCQPGDILEYVKGDLDNDDE
jgi:DNA-binding Xre family transcriptional regulator